MSISATTFPSPERDPLGSPSIREHPAGVAGDQRSEMAQVTFILGRNSSTISAPLRRSVRQVSAPLVLVLSIAVLVLVLVLVLDSSFGYPSGSLERSSQHRPIHVKSVLPHRFEPSPIASHTRNRTAHPRHIMNRIAFPGRSPSDLEKSVFVVEILIPAAFGNIRRNRLGGEKPLMVESWFCHHAPFEYEYRCPGDLSEM